MTSNPDRSDEVPEADALEQGRGLVDDEDTVHEPESLEVPEADAFEQRQPVVDDDSEENDR